MINFKAVSLRRGQRLLFENASFTFHRGEKIGITGANGAGKSSLFQMILGTLASESGEISMPPDLEIAHVAQEISVTDRSALDYVLDGDHVLRQIEDSIRAAETVGDGVALARYHAQFESLGGYEANTRAAKLLRGLGFSSVDGERPVAEFSGGWRVRLNIAQALMCPSDLLLLDEPTNHLDLDTVIWLQEWLTTYPGTLLLISHDRDFLDDLTYRILHIEKQTITLYTGNYSAFENRRAELLAQQHATYARQQREIEHVRSFIDRFRAQATKARQVQSRLKALERMELAAKAQADSPFEFSFLPPSKLSAPLLKLESVSVGYSCDAPLLEQISLTINPGDRIGLLGPNGAGKSTLMKLLAGLLSPLSGKRTTATCLKLGYFAQHPLESLRPEESPLWHLQQIDSNTPEKVLRGFLGGFGFQGNKALEPIAPFSGGEKSRLALALLIYQRPNLLLLDEPTNHLDLQARDALSVSLQSYDGALVIVSHDRYLLRTVTDQFQWVGDSTITSFTGDLEEYRKWLDERQVSDVSDYFEKRSTTVSNALTNRKEQRRSEAERRKALQPLKQALQKAEVVLERCADEKSRLEKALLEPSLYETSAKTRLQGVLLAKGEAEKALLAAEAAWLEASEAFEIATHGDIQ